MEKAILGKKLGMTQLFCEDGALIPVTVIEAGPCVVVQKKNAETDGYEAVQLGFADKAERKMNKPQKGHFDKAGVAYKAFLKELAEMYKVDNINDYLSDYPEDINVRDKSLNQINSPRAIMLNNSNAKNVNLDEIVRLISAKTSGSEISNLISLLVKSEERCQAAEKRVLELEKEVSDLRAKLSKTEG